MNGRTDKYIASESYFLARLAASDDYAWSVLYGQYAPLLRRAAKHRGACDPEDIVQDVMVRFLSALREGRVGISRDCNVGAYLVTLAKNLIVDRHRRDLARCRDAMVPFDEFMLPTSRVTLRPVEIREEVELRKAARLRALTTWSGCDRTKTIYRACVLEGRSVGEVAKALGIPPNTVSQIKRRGLKKARMLATVAA